MVRYQIAAVTISNVVGHNGAVNALCYCVSLLKTFICSCRFGEYYDGTLAATPERLSLTESMNCISTRDCLCILKVCDKICYSVYL